eukprot:jgi/Bigna1/27833/gw1.66.100.1
MLSHKLLFRESENFTSGRGIAAPPTVPINHYYGPRTNKIEHDSPIQISNYELFNCNNINIRYWSWNYRGCWHQTCPPMDTR